MAISSKLKKKLAERQEKLAKKGGSGNMPYFFFKEGTTRMRLLNVGGEEEPGIEITTFYLSKDIGGVISPVSFGGKCAIHRAFEKFEKSKDETERDLAKKLKPKKRFMALAVRYKDESGKELDTDAGAKPALLSNGQYQAIVDFFLDDEQGDMTDPLEGYDLKFKRTGKGQLDTVYSVLPCKPSKCPKEFRGPYNLEEEVKKIMPSYEETKELLAKFLNTSPDEDEDDAPSKPIKKKKKKSTKKDY